MKKKNRIVIIVLILLLMFLIFCAFYNGLVTKKYVILTDEIESDKSIRIVLISDLHSHIYGENQKDIVSLIAKQKPDIIALAGDIADDGNPIEGTKLFLAGIKGIAPIFYVSGNHEYWSNEIKNIKKAIRSYDVTILENNYVPVNVKNTIVYIAGVDDPDIMKYTNQKIDWYENMKNMFFELKDKPGFKILLAHRPELIEYYRQSDIDLVLSGHAHGGQVRIPLILNGLYSPNQGWFPRYAGGVYKYNSLTHIVSRGVSYNPHLPRVFNPPEVVVIDIN